MPTLEAQLAALITSLGADFKTLAPKASPVFTGHPKGVTEAAADNSTNLATTAYVDSGDGLLVPKSTVTTKGDLIVASGAGAVARLGVSGTDGRVLTEDSASANGVKWAAAGSASAPTIVGSTSVFGTLNSAALTVPAGTVAGDLIVAFISSKDSGVNNGPGGAWVWLTRTTNSWEDVSVFVKRAVAGDAGTSYSWGYTGNNNHSAHMVAVRGAVLLDAFSASTTNATVTSWVPGNGTGVTSSASGSGTTGFPVTRGKGTMCLVFANSYGSATLVPAAKGTNIITRNADAAGQSITNDITTTADLVPFPDLTITVSSAVQLGMGAVLLGSS